MKIRHEVEIVGLSALRRNLGAKKSSFRKKVFTASEHRYCRSNRMLLEHYGARLAAKRAVLKALGLKVRDSKLLQSVEVRKSSNGQPYVKLAPGFFRRQRLSGKIRIEISLAHERKFAIASVLVIIP